MNWRETLVNKSAEMGVVLWGRSAHHLELLGRLERVAPKDVEVLITGPTGVGKELYARYLHEHSARTEQPFVAVNCGALPASLFENELFGHVGGAFTGARPASEGLVAQAGGGTLFLDEIDTLSLAGQVKLLRFVQQKEYRRLGESRLRQADVRLVAATNADLRGAVERGEFRADLFFRLRVAPIEVAPLAARPEDLELLSERYCARYAAEYGVETIRFSEAAWAAIESYAWPGNVRELENCIRYLTCLQLDGPVEVKDLPLLDSVESPASGRAAATAGHGLQSAKRELVDNFERDYLRRALEQSGGNVARAARASGKPRRAFFELMRKHGIDADEFRGRDTA